MNRLIFGPKEIELVVADTLSGKPSSLDKIFPNMPTYVGITQEGVEFYSHNGQIVDVFPAEVIDLRGNIWSLGNVDPNAVIGIEALLDKTSRELRISSSEAEIKEKSRTQIGNRQTNQTGNPKYVPLNSYETETAWEPGMELEEIRQIPFDQLLRDVIERLKKVDTNSIPQNVPPASHSARVGSNLRPSIYLTNPYIGKDGRDYHSLEALQDANIRYANWMYQKISKR